MNCGKKNKKHQTENVLTVQRVLVKNTKAGVMLHDVPNVVANDFNVIVNSNTKRYGMVIGLAHKNVTTKSWCVAGLTLKSGGGI